MRQNKKSQSLSITLAISFLPLILTSLLIFGTIQTFFNFRTQQNIIFSQQQLIAQIATNKVTDFIQEKLSAMETTARLVNPSQNSLKELDRILNYLLGPNLAFRQLVLLNSNLQKIVGISRLSREASSELDYRFSIDLLHQTSQGKKYISSVYIDNVTSEPMIIMSVPVKDVFGDFQGILITEVNLKFMWDLVESLKIGKKGLAYVVDRQGNLIAFGDISRVLKGENLSNLKVVSEFIKKSTSSDAKPNIFKGIIGTLVIGTYAPLGILDWAVVTEIPLIEAFQTVFQTIAITMALMLIMVVFAGYIGIYLARRMASPIVNLMKIATRIANGEIELQAEVSGPNEILSLAIAFNSMTAQLREVINSLKQRSRHLQSTVQKYVEYMIEVGQGKLDIHLEIEKKLDEIEDPLLVLGQQLNNTTNKLKKHEENIQIYAEKLKKSNNELEQFAYIASHDLQEPLRKIQFFGNKLQNNSNILDEKAIEYIQIMSNAANRMDNFIKDLLLYSRVTRKTKPFENVDLNEIIKDVISNLEIRINETKAEIKIDKFPTIEADPLQMRQLFQNIIGNAIKYHRENVSSVININSKILNNENSNICEINITDNGIGFNNKYVDQIFELFQRLHGRNEYEGTGIGLAVCKKIVEHHCGVIKAFSKEGEGSTFSVQLPLKQKQNE